MSYFRVPTLLHGSAVDRCQQQRWVRRMKQRYVEQVLPRFGKDTEGSTAPGPYVYSLHY